MKRGGTVLKLAGTAALWAALGFAAGILLAATIPNLLGYRSLTVLTGSMQPRLMVGDMVIGKWIRADQAKVGDIVTFKDSERNNELVTHRVRAVKITGNVVSVVTKGDANDAVERWQTPRDGQISRVEYDIPKLGYAANAISGRYAKLLLVLIPAMLLAIYELVRIWRPADDDKPQKLGGGADATAVRES